MSLVFCLWHAEICRSGMRMQELDSLAWFGSLKGVASLLADAMKEDGAYTLVEVGTALQAAHLLVWQHEVEHGGAFLLPVY